MDAEIKTLDSLINVGRKTTGGWRLVDDIDWASIPIGLCPGEYLLLYKCPVAKLGSKAEHFLSGKREGGERY